MTQDSERLANDVTRRKFILASGAAGAVALAGCTSDEEGDGDSGGDGSDGSDGDDGMDGGSETDTTSGGSDQLSGEIIVKGSSTVFPISDRMAEEFMNEHPEVNVTVDSTGSGGGFENWFCPGDSDLNGASRPIKDSEVEMCSDNGVEPVEFEIAGDALTMAVNNDADWVDSITFDELSQIWREDSAQMWSDVRDEWPDEEFALYGPAETSGTYDWFNANVVGEDYNHTAQHQPTEEDEQIVQGIRDNPNAMGYFGYAYYKSNSDQVKAVKIAAEEGDEPSEPSLANAKDGSYPMARPLFIYAAKSSLERENFYQFMNFYLTQAETEIVQEIGYVPSSVDMRDSNLEKLDEAAGR